MGFFYQDIELVKVVLLIIFTFGIIGLNEFSRKNLKNGIISFVILPAFLFVFVWPKSVPGTSVDDWFFTAKIIAILTMAWIILALRYSEKIQKLSWFKYLVPLFLAINMIEAILKDIELSSFGPIPVMHDGLMQVGGGWNLLNAASGILNVIAICGFVGIYISRDKTKTLVWPDMTMFWIIGYDIWNFTFVYNCVGDRSFYVAGILIACTVAAHSLRKGAWMQHRVFTLCFNQMISLTIPQALIASDVTVHATQNVTALWTLSIISLATNVALVVYQGVHVYKTKRNPFTEEIYFDQKEYIEIVEEDKLREGAEVVTF